jgi:hypothetical protein
MIHYPSLIDHLDAGEEAHASEIDALVYRASGPHPPCPPARTACQIEALIKRQLWESGDHSVLPLAPPEHRLEDQCGEP